MNGLEKLDKIFEDYGLAGNFSGHFIRISTQEKMLEPIKKELKALEIIKRSISSATSLDTLLRELLFNGKINQDEFFLLREVLR